MIAISLGTIGILVFILSCSLLGGAIYFFMDSMKKMKKMKEDGERQQYKFHITPEQPKEKALKPKRFSFTKAPAPSPKSHHSQILVPTSDIPADKLYSLKESFEQQNRILNKLLKEMDTTPVESVPDNGLMQKVEDLEIQLEDKEEELQELRKQNEVTKKMMVRFEEVQKEFALMQSKMAELEKQASQAGNLIIELEDTKEAFNQMKKEWSRKNEKLQEVLSENQRLHQQLAETEDKLQQANLQRQQLFKKVKVLEEMNTDFQMVSEANQKLQTELRRIGELESMLTMMTQERDHLLRKRLH